jgi:hypothetical protein
MARRLFTRQLGGAIFGFLFLRTLCRADALAGPVKGPASEWLLDMERLSHDLAAGTLEQVEWQRGIEQRLANVELTDLLAAIDYDRLAKTVVLADDHEAVEEIMLSRSTKMPETLSFSPYFYALKKGRAIVPHGHHNMATMHMVLHGQAHVRHFDRIADEPDYITVRPTTDRVGGPGDVSTISDDRENVHWFVALSEPVYLFNIGVYGIRASEPHRGRDYIDPLGGETSTDGSIRARRVNADEAYRLYGKSGR